MYGALGFHDPSVRAPASTGHVGAAPAEPSRRSATSDDGERRRDGCVDGADGGERGRLGPLSVQRAEVLEDLGTGVARVLTLREAALDALLRGVGVQDALELGEVCAVLLGNSSCLHTLGRIAERGVQDDRLPVHEEQRGPSERLVIGRL